MKYLLDTHTFIWHALEDPRLSVAALEKIESDQDLYISNVSIWEMAIKIQRGRLHLKKPLLQFIESIVQANQYQLLDIKTSHLYPIATLPYHHKDPFDRLIIAQGMEEDMTIITKDEAFKSYEVNVLW
jgi:PIN domain nuclease of toxin-antitoxin system